ncbi:MAG: nucleotidyltransferase family protein [Eubacterium sp.]
MIKTGDREKDYLLLLLRCAILKQSAPVKQNIDMNRLLKLAKDQQVYSTVLPCLEATQVLTDEDRINWNNYRLTELQKTLVVNHERESILADFDKNGVKYILLKGLIIRELYPETLMRQMSDNDIMITYDSREAAAEIMKAHGFFCSSSTDKSDDYLKEPYTMIELHLELFNHEYMKEIFTSDLVWSTATSANDGTMLYKMKDELSYAFTLLHMFKHYIMEGCGIRFLCDMYLLNKNSQSLDFNYIDDLLQRIQDNPTSVLIEDLPDISIPYFKSMVDGLALAVFEDKKPTEDQMGLLTDMLNGAVYGKGVSYSEKVSSHGGKLGYIIYRLFPKWCIMKDNYPVLGKLPFLLPFFYIKRIFDRMRYKKSAIKKEIKNIKKV